MTPICERPSSNQVPDTRSRCGNAARSASFRIKLRFWLGQADIYDQPRPCRALSVVDLPLTASSNPTAESSRHAQTRPHRRAALARPRPWRALARRPAHHRADGGRAQRRRRRGAARHRLRRGAGAGLRQGDRPHRRHRVGGRRRRRRHPGAGQPAGIDALLEVWPIFEAFQAIYVSKGLLLDAEKNASAPSPTGTSAGATATARPAARARARTARRG